MSDFLKYPHLERFGTPEVHGLEEGECYIFPKLDGTNASAWLENGEIQGGSRKRHLTLDADNAGFLFWLQQQENIKTFLNDYPEYRLYGEWLVPHTVKTYKEDAWRKFYIFDVLDNNTGKFLHYNEYVELLKEYKIDYVPVMNIINNPTIDKLLLIAKTNTFLIQEGEGCGEGIVIKRYDFENKYGRTIWGKLVTDEFRNTKSKKSVQQIEEIHKTTEEIIVEKYCTEAFITKEYEKLKLKYDGALAKKHIGELLGRTYDEFIKEEAYIFIKELKNPKVDFKIVGRLVYNKIKETLKDGLF